LTQRKVVSWFRGRFEWGPRALGHRSILADPRSIEMKEVVNLKIKFREPFRPFAPVVLEERTTEYFAFRRPQILSGALHAAGGEYSRSQTR
jgi:carbamoyltransferase